MQLLLIHMNQYNTDKQNLEKKIRDVDKNISGVRGLVTTLLFLMQKLEELKKKFLITIHTLRRKNLISQRQKI